MICVRCRAWLRLGGHVIEYSCLGALLITALPPYGPTALSRHKNHTPTVLHVLPGPLKTPLKDLSTRSSIGSLWSINWQLSAIIIPDPE